ncbi:TIGR02757 family protein [Pseudotamlana carrageenivorans]|uniref:TIGR02757 family protein n=1 Tax=Pseudotamlana carrageenivorans TaxID=2069432 RepID=A0A2I7SND4_9FLAO|nr:TIGR02757 family protein [Tamlana carrageenivorans]AUS07393.1 TIGR02757 family protein [Tamlana carrageenivorans]
MKTTELKEFLDSKVLEYNNPKFIDSDPIQIPHRFSLKEDIEIASFLAATIAWGNRKMIIKNADKIMQLLGNSPYDFVMNHQAQHLDAFDGFVHRTFNAEDLKYFITSLKNIYLNHGGLENVFMSHASENSMQPAIHAFKTIFFSIEHPQRSQKHVGDPNKGSAAKRLNMMLRWLVRNDQAGVDFGLWTSIPASKLSCPLDVHSGNVARKLGLLKRKQNDAKALTELDTALRILDPKDPVKYDFALFGLGVFEGF